MRRDVFVFVDALGWDLVSHTGFLADLLPHRRAVEMQFGYSCSAIPAILSGTRPAANGHLSLFRYAPASSPFRTLAALRHVLRPAAFWRRGRVRHWLSKAVKRALGFTGYFQLYAVPFDRIGFLDYCEKRDLFAAGGLGEIENLFDAWTRQGVRFHVSDWRRGDDENLARALEAVRAGAEKVFVYTAALDAIRHDHAADLDADAIRARLAGYAAAIRALHAALAASGRPFALTVFSDHGMTPLVKTVDLQAAVAATGLVFGRDYGACCDATLYRVTYLADRARRLIPAALAPFAADGRWLTEAEERALGIWRADRAFGDAIFLVNPGVQIVPSDMGLKPLGGMHGYDPADEHSRAAILSTEPVPGYVRHVADYFKLMTGE